MAKKLFVKLQTPVIELKVQSTDAANEKDTILIGFRRYGNEELKKLFEKQTESKIELLKKLEALKEDQFQEKLELLSSDLADKAQQEAIEDIKKDIVYIKNAKVDVFDEDTLELLETIEIPDTRTATTSSFWGDAKECLKVLVEHYLDSSPWKDSISAARNKALLNREYMEEKAKN